MTEKNAEPLRPIELGAGKVRFAQGMKAGSWVFATGVMAQDFENGIAAAALMTEGTQWARQPIKLETEFIITKRMVQSLALAGVTLDDVVHAQVYLTDPDDYSAFNEAWTRHFAKNPPTIDIIPCIPHGLAPYDGRIDINLLALKRDGSTRRQAIDAGVPTAF